MDKKNSAIRKISLSAVIAALTMVFTAYVLHIPMSIFGGQGYVHIGDAVIYIGASLLPTGYACMAAAVGGSLADVLCGSAIWAPWTIVIKILVTLCFTSKKNKLLTRRNYIALPVACAITVLGYYLAESILYGSFVTPIYSIIGNVMQGVASSALYIALALVLDKVNIKKQINF